ncbi:hypothetical protein BDW42DRAFT_64301 [Aspergillus taichungensis]|uniref:Uncharacterized protein n=1 Tax=Aspergillus taichungensis TaxID=482145 RepID=A0A2J5I197_9EURO|nr:hypothetical protein BDW42DRAFT_64301 [Aspergillus taichungensis]
MFYTYALFYFLFFFLVSGCFFLFICRLSVFLRSPSRSIQFDTHYVQSFQCFYKISLHSRVATDLSCRRVLYFLFHAYRVDRYLPLAFDVSYLSFMICIIWSLALAVYISW